MDKTASNVAVEAGRALLLERLALCTPEQQAFYHKIYPGGPHGLADTHKDQLNTDLLAFLKA